MVNDQGEQRLTILKEKFFALAAKAASLKAALKVERKHGAHLDQMAAFWQEQGVCNENKPVPIPIKEPEPFIEIESLPEEEEPENERKRRVNSTKPNVTMIVKSPDSEEEISLLHHLSSHSTGTTSSYCGSCCYGRGGSDSDRDQDDTQQQPMSEQEDNAVARAAVISATAAMI